MKSAAWSRPVSSPCYTEHGHRYGAVLVGHITTVVISRSDQLGLRYTIESNCSGMFACLAGDSLTRDRDLDTYESSYVPRTAKPFFIPVFHSPLGALWYVTALELSSRGGEAGVTWQRRSPSRQGGEVRS
jgi:hypothetical protein